MQAFFLKQIHGTRKRVLQFKGGITSEHKRNEKIRMAGAILRRHMSRVRKKKNEDGVES